jgi:hypothetical protein
LSGASFLLAVEVPVLYSRHTQFVKIPAKFLTVYSEIQKVTQFPSSVMAQKLITPTDRDAPRPTKNGFNPSLRIDLKLVFSPTPARATTRKTMPQHNDRIEILPLQAGFWIIAIHESGRNHGQRHASFGYLTELVLEGGKMITPRRYQVGKLQDFPATQHPV